MDKDKIYEFLINNYKWFITLLIIIFCLIWMFTDSISFAIFFPIGIAVILIGFIYGGVIRIGASLSTKFSGEKNSWTKDWLIGFGCAILTITASPLGIYFFIFLTAIPVLIILMVFYDMTKQEAIPVVIVMVVIGLLLQLILGTILLMGTGILGLLLGIVTI